MTDKSLHIENIGQTFETKRDPLVTLRDINLTVVRGECATLIGHSGCGKSTLLSLIARLTRPTTDGSILVEREIAGPGLDRAVAFQNYSLLPWLTCFDSVYPAVERVFGKSKTETQLCDHTYTVSALVGLSHVEQKYPYEISNGTRWHVGIACTLSMEPEAPLMDEPFDALDALARAHLQDELLRVATATGSTVVIVMHDVDEVVLPADHIIMMTNGPAATISEVLAVDLPRPRDRMALAEDPAYYAYRTAVLDFLYRKRRHPVAEVA